MNLAFLLDLSVRGSLVLLAVAVADHFSAETTASRWRRVWWLLVPLAFLAPMSFRPVLPAYLLGDNSVSTSPITHVIAAINVRVGLSKGIRIPVGPFTGSDYSWLGVIWLAGALVMSMRIFISTWRVQRRWSRARFSTDTAVLDVLEDAKAAAGVTAPIGLLVSDDINAPALLGWLRPRILLPTHLTLVPAQDLRAVLLHELAHFKALDIPLNWLFASVRIVHWFNPLAYVASSAWARFVEEAADENAIRWMHESTGMAYGEILLKTLGSCPGGPAPYGALAIGESIANLKRRILMIRHYHTKSSRGWVAAAVVFTLGALLALSPTFAADEDPGTAKQDAVVAMQTWLAEIDAGDYAKSWSDSAQNFQQAVTSDGWTAALNGVRAPLGKSLARKQVSAALQIIPPKPGSSQGGTYVIAQFDSSFENMKYARETVTFQKEDDGSWRAAGYYIKPQ
jgi:beta-lactamase regulating signal transducer with metallopeptidase domain